MKLEAAGLSVFAGGSLRKIGEWPATANEAGSPFLQGGEPSPKTVQRLRQERTARSKHTVSLRVPWKFGMLRQRLEDRPVVCVGLLAPNASTKKFGASSSSVDELPTLIDRVYGSGT